MKPHPPRFARFPPPNGEGKLALLYQCNRIVFKIFLFSLNTAVCIENV